MSERLRDMAARTASREIHALCMEAAITLEAQQGVSPSAKLESLPEGLRETATYLGVADTGETAERAKHLMRLAADRLESYETAERERLEHEAVAPECDLPLIPWPPPHAADSDAAHRVYNEAMVAWVRLVGREG